MKELKLQELKTKTAGDLIEFAKENGVENSSSLRKQELLFAILKKLAEINIEIIGEGVIEILICRMKKLEGLIENLVFYLKKA